MKALTIHQPWAAAIAHGGKRVENRAWLTYHRGLIAIHAGASVGIRRTYDRAIRSVTVWSGYESIATVVDQAAVRGAVVAVASLGDVCSASRFFGLSMPLQCDCGNWAQSGQRHFILTDVHPLPTPVPARGAQQLWTLPDEVEKAVRAQLGEAMSHG